MGVGVAVGGGAGGFIVTRSPRSSRQRIMLNTETGSIPVYRELYIFRGRVRMGFGEGGRGVAVGADGEGRCGGGGARGGRARELYIFRGEGGEGRGIASRKFFERMGRWVVVSCAFSGNGGRLRETEV